MENKQLEEREELLERLREIVSTLNEENCNELIAFVKYLKGGNKMNSEEFHNYYIACKSILTV